MIPDSLGLKSSLKCKPGKFFENGICKLCWPQSPYYFIISNCTETSNAVIRCKEDFYFDSYFERDPCRKCTGCKEGFSIAEPCSETNDTICCPQKDINCAHKPSTNSTNSTSTLDSADDSLKPDEVNVSKRTNIVVASVVSFVFVVVGIILFVWWKRKHSGVYKIVEPTVGPNDPSWNVTAV